VCEALGTFQCCKNKGKGLAHLLLWAISHTKILKPAIRETQTPRLHFPLSRMAVIKNTVRAGDMDHVVEYLPTKCEVLSSNPNTNKKLII
jgi:hypothetical protein